MSGLLAVAVAGRGLVDPAGPLFPADDEALLRGGCAFETARVYAGRPFLLERHLARLERSAAALALPPPDGAGELAALVVAASPPDHVLRLYRSDSLLVATSAALPSGLEEERARGMTLATLDIGAPPRLLAGVKSTSYAQALAARRTSGADEVVFLAGSRVLECATANIWWSADGALFTPATGPGVLDGVTKGFLVELGGVVEGDGQVADLRGADEVFTSSSIREVMPVVAVDGNPVGDGRPGPAAARLQAALRLRSAE
jgi:branched-subunit amino acid aminotransferase/4-amino-4-deoxychorismate lyase